MSSKTERLDRVIDLTSQLQGELMDADELEEITDLLIDELLERIRLPWWAGWVKGWLRKSLDAWLPGGLFQALASAAQAVRRRIVTGDAGR